MDSLGFPWSKADIPFHEYLNQLKEYKERYGHANPPKIRGPVQEEDDEFYALKKWCSNIKCYARNFEYNQSLPDDADEKDKKGTVGLTDEKIRQLEEVGFIWKKQTKDFDRRLNDLIAYKDVYGKTSEYTAFESLLYSLLFYH